MFLVQSALSTSMDVLNIMKRMENAFGYLSLELVKQKNGLRNKKKKERKSNSLNSAKVAKDFGYRRIVIRYIFS